MQQCDEIKDGQVITKYGDVFIRGNNGMIISKLFYN